MVFGKDEFSGFDEFGFDEFEANELECGLFEALESNKALFEGFRESLALKCSVFECVPECMFEWLESSLLSALGVFALEWAESSSFANALLFGYGFVMLKVAKQSIKELGWKFRLFGLLFV